MIPDEDAIRIELADDEPCGLRAADESDALVGRWRAALGPSGPFDPISHTVETHAHDDPVVDVVVDVTGDHHRHVHDHPAVAVTGDCHSHIHELDHHHHVVGDEGAAISLCGQEIVPIEGHTPTPGRPGGMRRVRRLRISAALLMGMFARGPHPSYTVYDGVPIDTAEARVVGLEAEGLDRITLYVEHPLFEVVDADRAGEIPFLDVEMWAGPEWPPPARHAPASGPVGDHPSEPSRLSEKARAQLVLDHIRGLPSDERLLRMDEARAARLILDGVIDSACLSEEGLAEIVALAEEMSAGEHTHAFGSLEEVTPERVSYFATLPDPRPGWARMPSDGRPYTTFEAPHLSPSTSSYVGGHSHPVSRDGLIGPVPGHAHPQSPRAAPTLPSPPGVDAAPLLDLLGRAISPTPRPVAAGIKIRTFASVEVPSNTRTIEDLCRGRGCVLACCL